MAAIVFRKVRHTPAVAVSRAAPGTIVSFASSTGEAIHACAPARYTITHSAVGALNNAMSGVSGRCLITPRETGRAHTLRAITTAPAGPAIAPFRKQNTRTSGGESEKRNFDPRRKQFFSPLDLA